MNVGAFGTAGAFAGGPGYGRSYPHQGRTTFAVGAFAGFGHGGFLPMQNVPLI